METRAVATLLGDELSLGEAGIETARRHIQNDRLATAHFYRDAIGRLLDLLGADHGSCSSCSAPIRWVVTKAGKRMPINRDGFSHFADCPNAGTHRKAR